MGRIREIGDDRGCEVTYCEEVGTLPWPVGLIPTDMLRIWGAPCACIIPSNRMLDFNDFSTVAIHPISLQLLQQV